ncbi:MAG: YeeE/YedE family protein, partial [Gammaproteobacteria bacterium]
LFLQNSFDLKQAVLFLVGVGFGISLMHALFGFTGGWFMMIARRRSIGVRAQLILFALSAILFFPILGEVFPGIKVSAALAPFSVSVLVGAFLFGIGMQMGGGCGSGTLFTVGWGQTDMLITLSFFIIGATVGSVHLPWWLSFPNAGKISLIQEFSWLPGLLITLVLLAVLYKLVTAVERKQHGNVMPLISKSDKPFMERLVFGPWPVWWGAIGLAVFGLLTLLIAGYPWSITYAFGLWGAKIWSALGGDVSNWAYWSSGYPAKSLNSSVLADVTSVMDFGIMLGALLAAALASKFAPEGKIKSRRVITAVIGGLLLGYGARLAFGCNIGALLAGISTGSLHGWLWLVAGFCGAIVGVKLRARIEKG